MHSFSPSPHSGPLSSFQKKPLNVRRLHFSLSPSGSVVREEPLGSLYFCQAGPLAFLRLLRPFSWLSPHLLRPWSQAELRFSGGQLLSRSSFDHLTTWKHNSWPHVSTDKEKRDEERRVERKAFHSLANAHTHNTLGKKLSSGAVVVIV